MAGLPIIPGDIFVEGLNLEFFDTLEQRKPAPDAAIRNSMRIDIPSNKRVEEYVFDENAPLIRRWLAGTRPNFGTFKHVRFSVENLDWKEGFSWLRKDRRDDKTGRFVERAQRLGGSVALLDEDVFYQINAGSVDARLLEDIPLASDGQALHSATGAGGVDRFLVSGGNIVTGVSVASAANIRTAFFNGTSRARRFQNTKGQQLLNNNDVEAVTIFFSAVLEQVFREAFQQTRIQGTAAAPTNIIQESGFKITLVPTQKLTGNDFFMYFDNVTPKAIFSQLREGFRTINITEDNSQESAETGLESMMVEGSKAFGIVLPFATLKMTA